MARHSTACIGDLCSRPLHFHKRHPLTNQLEGDLGVSAPGFYLGRIRGGRELTGKFHKVGLIGGGALRGTEGLPSRERI